MASYTEIRNTVIVSLARMPSPYDATIPDFETVFPQAIYYAEDRIYRDLTLLATRTANSSLTTSSGSRTLSLSSMTGSVIIVPEGVALITPSGTTNPALGTRVTFDAGSLDMIDVIWPQESVAVAPNATLAANYGRWWALKDATTMVLAPTPGANYTAEITGLYRPATLASGNTPTYLSTNYPDVLVAAIMVWMMGMMNKNWSAMADDPKAAVTWEGAYQVAKQNALLEEQRRRSAGVGWSQNLPTPLAQPQRT